MSYANTDFERYLHDCGITIQQAAREAKVPQMIIFRILNNHPISIGMSQKVRNGLSKYTGVRYINHITVER